MRSHDDVVQDLAAATSDPALRNAVLPWRLNTGALRLKASRLQKNELILIKFRVVV